MKFLIDNALSHQVASGLSSAGHDATHVRDLGIQHAADDVILGRAAAEGRVLVSGDTDFGGLLERHGLKAPSVILFRRASQRRPALQVTLLLANLTATEESLREGALVVIEETRIRIRLLPIATERTDSGEQP